MTWDDLFFLAPTEDKPSEPQQDPKTMLPKIRCYCCDKELSSTIYDGYYWEYITMTHSCCTKNEVLKLSKDALLKGKVPAVWVAFISANPEIL